MYLYPRRNRTARTGSFNTIVRVGPLEGKCQPHARKISPSAWRIAVARVMFLWECISRQFERNPLRRSILSYRISWETENALSRHNLSRKYEFLLDTSGQSDIDAKINADLLSVRTIQAGFLPNIWMTRMRRVIRSRRKRYLRTYVRPICESNGIGCRPAGLFAGRWTWLFCGLGTTAIYITSED